MSGSKYVVKLEIDDAALVWNDYSKFKILLLICYQLFRRTSFLSQLRT